MPHEYYPTYLGKMNLPDFATVINTVESLGFRGTDRLYRALLAKDETGFTVKDFLYSIPTDTVAALSSELSPLERIKFVGLLIETYAEKMKIPYDGDYVRRELKGRVSPEDFQNEWDSYTFSGNGKEGASKTEALYMAIRKCGLLQRLRFPKPIIDWAQENYSW